MFVIVAFQPLDVTLAKVGLFPADGCQMTAFVPVVADVYVFVYVL